jgi:hypothetical protein
MMRDFLDQVEAAVNAHLYYLALFACLALPDICAAMESVDGEATKQRYLDWFDQWLPQYAKNPFVQLTALDCYLFRCSLLHQGSAQHPKSTYDRILFVEPGTTTNVFHLNSLNGALNIDVTNFCRDILAAARTWIKTAESTPNYQQNFPRFMTRYPGGLAPYIVGLPVIG